MNITQFLRDLVNHTHSLSIIDSIKITPEENSVRIDSISEDKSIILMGHTLDVVDDFEDTFGLTNLTKLKYLLNCSEYQNNSTISVTKEKIKNKEIPTGLHFVNETSDFQNSFKFMSEALINSKISSLTFKVNTWNVDFEPTAAAISKFKAQAGANSEESIFNVRVKNNNLIFQFGEDNNHNGSLIFCPNVQGKLKHEHSWPIKQVQDILSLEGEKQMLFADVGALQITVTTELVVYNYIIPAVLK